MHAIHLRTAHAHSPVCHVLKLYISHINKKRKAVPGNSNYIMIRNPVNICLIFDLISQCLTWNSYELHTYLVFGKSEGFIRGAVPFRLYMDNNVKDILKPLLDFFFHF